MKTARSFRTALCFMLMLAACLSSAQSFAVVDETPSPATPGDCLECHDDFDKAAFGKSVHSDLSCADCHADLSDPTAHMNQEQTPAPVDCTLCHEADAFQRFGHGALSVQGNSDAPGCVFCHGRHDVFAIGDKRNRNRFTSLCIQCHGNREMMERNRQNTRAVDSYENTYHGQVRDLDEKTHVAGCADCHTGHNILPPTDPNSVLHPKNRIAQCAKCHPKANVNFVKFHSHPEYFNRAKNPILFWTVLVMTTILTVNLLLFGLHTGLWWKKTWWESLKNLRRKETKAEPGEGCCDPAQCFTRFSLLDRLMHLALLISFFGLVITGIPLLFHRASWARWMMGLLGGPETAGLIHRILAGVQIGLLAVAFGLILRFWLRRKKGAPFFFHPDSVFFNKKDWRDLKGMVRWFFDSGEKPRFDRWTYWEKADIFAFFWGMLTIGLSGLILWFPETFAQRLPGWIFNVAVIVHSFEAMLAAMVIFMAHFFNTHLLPQKFPLDMVMFTGRLRRHEFIAERPLHYSRLEAEGQLEQKKSRPPSSAVTYLYRAFGICSLVLGWILAAMIVIGLFSM